MTVPPGPLRIAVAGVGSFTQRVILPGLIACEDAELVALFGPTPEKTKRLAERFGIQRVYGNYVELLDHDGLDAIFVATPNHAHHWMVMAALKRRLAVACEKPLALTPGEAREMCELAEVQGVPTAVNFSYRSSAGYRQIAEFIADGKLGSIYHFTMLFLQGFKADATLPLSWRMQLAHGGGAVMDIGTHMLDLLHWWFGDLEAVCAQADIVVPERVQVGGGRQLVTADDTASCLLRTRSGLTGVMQLSQVAHGRQTYRQIALYGSAGSLVANDERGADPELHMALPGGSFECLQPSTDFQLTYDAYPAFHVDRIVHALRGDATDFPTFRDGLRAQESAQAMQMSARDHHWVEVPPELS